MLRTLSIRGFTIIDELELDFADGFTVITGETGAGKSLLVDVIGLLLGGRAAPGLVAGGHDQAELSAVIALPGDHPALDWLAGQSLAEGDECVLRRVLPREGGSSRAWINGRPATMTQLRRVGGHIVEIHGQNEHLRLLRPDAQRAWLDRHVADRHLTAVTEAAATWRDARDALARLEEAAGDARQREFLRYQLAELDELGLGDGEYAELEAEQARLARIDELLAAANAGLNAVDGDDPPGARTLIAGAVQRLQAMADIDESLGEVANMLGEAQINLDEAAAMLERHAAGLEADPERLAAVDRRLGKALELARKHRVEPEALPGLTETLRERHAALDDMEAEHARLEQALAETRDNWERAATELSKARRATAAELSGRINENLAKLGMGDGEVMVEVSPDTDAAVADHGRDHIEIRFTANPGQPPGPLRRIASGGELSRFSLALIAASQSGDGARVRIFDEVDAGVGGETAHAVGDFLRRAAGDGQAFAVTHLAQVAARADHHFTVEKSTADGDTRTAVSQLTGKTREAEIARMLGSRESRHGLARARELLKESA